MRAMRSGGFPIKSLMAGVVLGALAAVLAVLHIMANYEDGLYDQIVASTVQPHSSDTQKVVALTAATHVLLEERLKVFAGKNYVSIRDWWFPSGDVHLIDGRGACGSHAHVLGRLLDRVGIDFRGVQMYCADWNTWGCHATIEAYADGKWIAVDPSYNVVFPVSAAEVGRNWDIYKELTPPDYDMNFNYAGVRYTNWTKIPVIMPAIKRILDFAAPKFASTLSVRRYVLNLYRAYEVGLLSLLLVVAIFLLLRIAIVRRRSALSLMKPAASF
jgi:transglutaminase superfamily protein